MAKNRQDVADADSSEFIPRTSLSDVVYERVRDDILHGEIANGSNLNQVELAKRYGVSRIPVREALRRLQAESLVIATPYHQFVVRNVTAEQVLELVDIRAAVEDLALSKRKPLVGAEVAELRKLNKRMAQGRNGATFLTLDRELHQLIAGPETMAVEVLDYVRNKVHRYLSVMVAGKPGRTTAIQEHAGIIDALEAQDMELARRLIHEHVMQSRAFIASRLAAETTEATEPTETSEAGGGGAAKPAKRR